METNDSLKTLSASLAQGAAVERIFGEPFEANGKIILPVGKIVMGIKAGSGKNMRMGDSEAETINEAGNSGVGSGGGAIATPLGIFEITEKPTRYVSANATKYFLGGCILSGIIAVLLFRAKRNSKA